MNGADYKSGDMVVRSGTRVRGQVGWVDWDGIYVCWETGYQDYVRMSRDQVEPLSVLDAILEERETQFAYCSNNTRCVCGRKTSRRRRGSTCSYCKREYPD
ncbi:MAG: hypothetical protein AB7L09_02885 [Nitrospira sp.]